MLKPDLGPRYPRAVEISGGCFSEKVLAKAHHHRAVEYCLPRAEFDTRPVVSLQIAIMKYIHSQEILNIPDGGKS